MRIYDFSDGWSSASAPTASPITFPDGTVALPGMSFTNDTDSGLYRIGANNIGLSLGGVKYVDFGTTRADFTGTVGHPNGTSSLPSMTFASDPDTGFYRVGTNTLGATVGATQIGAWNSTGIDWLGSASCKFRIMEGLADSSGLELWRASGVAQINNAGAFGLNLQTNGSTRIGITAAGIVSITNSTASTAATNGALTVAGGLGVAESVRIGTNSGTGGVLGIPNNSGITFRNAANSANYEIYVDTSNLFRLPSIWSFDDTTDASSATTGSARIAGGLGVAKTLYVGTGIITVAATAGNDSLQNRTTDASTVATSMRLTHNPIYTGSTRTNVAQIVLNRTSTVDGEYDGTIELKTRLNGASLVTNLLVTKGGGVVCGNAAIATNATDGFLWIPTCAGTPSGTPVTQTGRVALVYDTSNNKLYVYNGSWKGGTAPGAWS